MPFSQTVKKRIRYIIEQKPLQVRIDKYKKQCFGKRSLRSVSAAMTLETVLVLTLFLFAAVCLILPMKILNTERRIQAALEAVGEDFSRYAYIRDVLQSGDDTSIPGADAFAAQFCHYLAAGAAEGYARVQAMEAADTGAVFAVTMERSQILTDEETFDLILDYKIRMPFPVLGVPAVQRTARCRRRAWIGLAGKDGKGLTAKGDREELVYIGKSSTRYHKHSSCHYLSNDLASVAYDVVAGLRNSSGGKYYPCSVCARTATGGTVYVMPSGSSFHTSPGCTAITAYVQIVPLSEVEHLGACSYCSGG